MGALGGLRGASGSRGVESTSVLRGGSRMGMRDSELLAGCRAICFRFVYLSGAGASGSLSAHRVTRFAPVGTRAARPWLPSVLVAVAVMAWSTGPSAASESAAESTSTRAANPSDHDDEASQRAVPHAPGRHFRAHDIAEPGAGHHHHAVVTVNGLALLVIRDEGAYKTPRDRAESVARALEESLHQGDRIFVADADAERPGVYVVSHHCAYPRLLLRVTRADAAAYSRRSGRAVSQEILAEWWTALLKDFIAVLFIDQAPQVVTSTHAGQALLEIRSRLSQLDGSSGSADERVQRVTAALPLEVRELLRSLAFSVPDEFAVSLADVPPADGPPTLEPL